MPISIDQWHVAVGLFGACRYDAIIKKMIWKYSNLKVLIILLFFYSTIIFLLLVQHNNVEINPGPPKKATKIFFMLSLKCQQSVNCQLAHNKIFLLTAYNTIHQYDVICISDIFLDSSVPLDDHNLSVQGYSLIWADHPDNVKTGGAYLYLKENLNLKLIGNSFIAQCIICEITLQNQKSYVAVTY